jgi:hypothetical protein
MTHSCAWSVGSCTIHTAHPAARGGRRGEAAATIPQRINVAINADMLAAIQTMIEQEHITLTEAVRRLVSYGDFLDRSSKDGHTIIVRAAYGCDLEVEQRVTLGQ